MSQSTPSAPASAARIEASPLAAAHGDAGGLLKLDRSNDLGPAGSFGVTARGAVFRTRADQLVVVPLDARLSERREGIAPLDARDASIEGLVWNAPPPALTRSHAYWVSGGKLVRRSVGWQSGARSGDIEVLAGSALDGSRVAVDTVVPEGGAGRDIVIYIAQAANATDERAAKLWTEGAQATPFSGEGSGASSVAVVRSGARVLGISLDARSAMSPVHARTIEVRASGPRIGADVVVFVGPSPEGHTEIAAAWGQGGAVALVPFARDTASFGLASLSVGEEPHLDAPVHWSMYPNGIEPAPVAAAVFCGRTWAAYVRPSASTAGAKSVLALSPLERGAFGDEVVTEQGFDFTMVALAPRDDGGAWLAWVGNGRSWVRGIRC